MSTDSVGKSNAISRLARAPLIGIDLVETERLRQRLERTPSLRRELFTPAELTYCEAQFASYQHLAARFCAKEAVAKALGLDGFEPHDIEISGGANRVQLVLHGKALARARRLRVVVSISLSHLEAIAAGIALALPTAVYGQAPTTRSVKGRRL